MTEKEIFELNIEKNGDILPLLLAEECGELIQAVSKLERFHRSDNTSLTTYLVLTNNLAEEIADVQIMISQIMIMHNISLSSVLSQEQKKIQRLESRLTEEL